MGVTGSISAYKAAYLVRLMKKEGALVRVVMTPSACEFITPLTLSTLSDNPVHVQYVENESTGEWANHVELGLWADLFLIAPITANTIGELVGGTASTLLPAVFLSSKCRVMIAPAMDLDMFGNPATQDNLEKLQQRGVVVLDSPSGELASGLVGSGRLFEPEDIVEAVKHFFSTNLPLNNKHVLITAGPTHEPIDPVRFIGNRSSGKMGFALADAAVKMGATVTLVSGPVALQTPEGPVTRIDVETAEEMLLAAQEVFEVADLCVMSAAVADYRPLYPSAIKMKKEDGLKALELVENPDILKTLGSKKTHQIIVGFALETNNHHENAQRKLSRKNADMIVLNQPGKDTGFASDTNQVTLITKNKVVPLQLLPKGVVAREILKCVTSEFFS